MHVAVVPLPSLLPHDSFAGRTVVVIDVLRATTTMACALAAGAREVRVFTGIAGAREAHRRFVGPKLLAGERDCLRPAGFDMGNSPREMTPRRVNGRTIFMTTTNGTRAIERAFAHPTLLVEGSTNTSCFAAALVNATATARAATRTGRDLVLLCAGSDGETVEEDLIGAGAVLDALIGIPGLSVACTDDAGAGEWFERFRRKGVHVMRQTRGGIKLLGAGLNADVAACAKLDAVSHVCHIDHRRWIRPTTQGV